MRHNKYICENPVTVEVSGDTYTFTLVDCRYTSPQVIQHVLNSFAKNYLCEQGLYALAPKTKCGNLLLTTTGKVASVSIPGLGGGEVLTIDGDELTLDSEPLTIGS